MARTMDELVAGYLKFREIVEAKKAAYQADIAPYHDAMAQLEGAFMLHMQTQGMDSFTTAAGTPYQSTRTSASVEDWDAFFGWALDNNQEGMLTRGANKTAVEEYIKQHQALPPGLKVTREIVVNVRKATAK